ncbi:hypothetical protein RHGRI_021610 [Rhododendron griersonianum]|uniref:EamA domain-containing protein n=1 Tax=Rhododendron griersonianum TaxID=479676 RepID=A0AAV6JKU1_9ERIC|nr:hypothetical protein RHGRI_021610 [Rhododendron griersonianum]
MREPVFLAAAFIGVLTGLRDYFYAYGVARLPVSTSALVNASRLSFTAVFAFLLVKQKFTLYSINAVALLAVGAGVLALHASSDRPKGEPNKEYYMGFFMTVTAAVLYGRFPKRLEILNWAKTTYYVLLVCFGIICQCFFLGAIGVVFSASSLFSAIITAVLLPDLPVIEILAVIFYCEKFQADKGVSLVLSLWGFASYFYGEIDKT